MVEISPHFDALASTKDNDRLFAMLPYKSLCFTGIKDRHGVYAMIGKDERRDVSIRRPRPSIRKQLTDSKQAADYLWKKSLFDDEKMFKNNKLCPVLSTAYGLSIGVTNDNIEKKPFRDIFKDRRGDKEDSQNKARSLGRDYGGFDYGDDWDAWK